MWDPYCSWATLVVRPDSLEVLRLEGSVRGACSVHDEDLHWSHWNKRKNMLLVVVKWQACSPTSTTIRIQILLQSTFFIL